MTDRTDALSWVTVLALALAACVVAASAAPLSPLQNAPAVTYSSNSLGLEFVAIPPGEFQMGCSIDAKPNECVRDERPPHAVQITKGFEIGKTQVTQRLWQAVMGTNPSVHKGSPELPVEQVSFEDVQAFLAKVNALNDGYLYRLPTEAEWEYVARAGTKDQYAGLLDSAAGDRSSGVRPPSPPASEIVPHPVATEKPNAWGVHDLRGNVLEWVQDWYDAAYYSKSPATDPKGPADGETRATRGTSYHAKRSEVFPFLFRASIRSHFPEAYSFGDLGFRVARDKR
jgi:formylglycine-generating enzyme required for sulfatase activity